MFEYKVLGLDEANHSVEQGWPTCVISVLSSDYTMSKMHKNHLFVDMDDVATAGSGKYPTRSHIDAILAHSAGLTSDDRLLVHCMVGQSRSTATLIMILIQHGMSAQDAFDAVKSIRPILMPNALIIELADSALGLNGSLITVVTNYVENELSRQREFLSRIITQSDKLDMKKFMDLFD